MFRSAVCVLVVGAHATEPNPPVWPSTARVFGPEDSAETIQAAVNAAFIENGGSSPADHGQFSSSRFSFLFKPGRYNVDVPVGYYTEVAGLGESPKDVVFTSSKGVYCEESAKAVSPGSLDTFWRAAANFQTDADFEWNKDGLKGMIWAASQGTSLRRLVVTNDLQFFQFRQGQHVADFASGGYFGNSEVKGTVNSGSQQQFISRNAKFSAWSSGVWNMNFVGSEGAPASHCGADPKKCSHPYVTVDSTPVVAEKPFISISTSGKYSLNIPKTMKDRKGFDFDNNDKVDFASVYVATANDTSAIINAKLKEGLHVVLSPGIYSLDAPLELNKDNQVLLGLGLATLVATSGTAAVKVGNVDGVRVAGILLEAGSQNSEVLLDWGDSSNRYAGNSNNPGVMNDIVARVGGPSKPSPAQAKVMLRINSGHVVLDNAWLWRADHLEGGGLARNGENPCEVGAIINGDDVTAYGLKSEHCLTDLLQWNGERGQAYFFQSEMPYDVTQANYGDKGYVAYRVAPTVKDHKAYGIGVYHYFRDHAVTVQSAISAPASLESAFVSPLAVFLNGKGVINHIVNDKGSKSAQDPTNPTNAVAQWVCAAATPARLLSSNTTCKAGDAVSCPGTSIGCAGNTCCPDGSTCPSAEEDFGCCPQAKKEDCVQPGPSPTPTPPAPPTPPTPPAPPTPPSPPAPPTPPTPTPTPPTPPAPPAPSPTPTCKVGDLVQCPGTGANCAGDQCCPDSSICPSASSSFSGCTKPKEVDCTKTSMFTMEIVV